MSDETEIWIGLFSFIAATIAMVWLDARPKLRFSLRSFLIAVAFATFVMSVVAAYSRF